MENKKNKLIESLNIVVKSLENDTIHYDWEKQSSCNCGVVAQALTGLSKKEVYDEYIKTTRNFNFGQKKDQIRPTWKNLVKHTCPITGDEMPNIIRKLKDNGLNKEDIVHLEYMDNLAILSRSGIETNKKEIYVEKVLDTETVNFVTKPHDNFIMRLFGQTQLVEETVKTYKEISKEKVVEVRKFYTKKENLIKYLKAWISILNEGSKNTQLNDLNEIELREELLVAESNEDYGRCSEIMVKLNKI